MWTLQEAAEKLGYHPIYIRALCREGKLRAQKIEGHWVVLDLTYIPLSLVPGSGVSRNGAHDQQARVQAGNRTITKRYLTKMLSTTQIEPNRLAIKLVLSLIDSRRPPRGYAKDVVLECVNSSSGPVRVSNIQAQYPNIAAHSIHVNLGRLTEQNLITKLGGGWYVAKSN